MKEPVFSIYGHLFEKEAIESWVIQHHQCPLTSLPLEKQDLYPQFTVKTAISKYRKLKKSIDDGIVKFNISDH